MNDHAVFDLYFRKNPFQGEFTIFAGLEECINFLQKFRYSTSGMYFTRLNYADISINCYATFFVSFFCFSL